LGSSPPSPGLATRFTIQQLRILENFLIFEFLGINEIRIRVLKESEENSCKCKNLSESYDIKVMNACLLRIQIKLQSGRNAAKL
jgi:hypothetical protein